MQFARGYYKTNYRALRFRELVRMHGLRRAFSGYLLSRFKRPDSGGWMPSLWADTECRSEDLSEQFWQATKPYRAHFERLGFTDCGFQKASKNLNPMFRETGGMRYLDSQRRYLGRLLYYRRRTPSTGAELNDIVIAFTAVFEQGSLSCTNNRKAFDPTPENEVIRLATYDVALIYQEFVNHLQRRKETPRAFPDLESLRQWHDAGQIKDFDERARRRLFIPMSEQEVAAAKRRLAQADAGIFPPPRQSFRPWLWAVIIALVLGLQFIRRHPGGTRDATLEYRGEHFRMRKAYATYEDYKDDQDNLDTHELDRIERVMTSARIPSSFKTRDTMVHILFDLKFPGYGIGGVGESVQTDDGSAIEVESVEIPQRNKDRYLVLRNDQGQWQLVDDFVYGTTTNRIQHVKLEKQSLRYYGDKGALIREKRL